MSIDLTNKKFGRLTAKEVVRNLPGKGNIWRCECECGGEKEVPAAYLRNGHTKSCGCLDKEHMDIAGRRWGRLTAVRPTEERDRYGSVIWELSCECGNTVYKTINTLKSEKVLSCGCLYKQTRSETVKHRRDLIAGISVSSIVVSKRLRSNNTSGHTGVSYDEKYDKWHAFIDFQGKHYNLGTHSTFQLAVNARKAAEKRLHDPVIKKYIDTLTPPHEKRSFGNICGRNIPASSGNNNAGDEYERCIEMRWFIRCWFADSDIFISVST